MTFSGILDIYISERFCHSNEDKT